MLLKLRINIRSFNFTNQLIFKCFFAASATRGIFCSNLGGSLYTVKNNGRETDVGANRQRIRATLLSAV